VVDHERIDALNELDESVTVATLPPFAACRRARWWRPSRSSLCRAAHGRGARVEVAKSANQPLVSVAPFKAMKAGLVQTRLPGTRDKVWTRRSARRQAAHLARQHADRRAALRHERPPSPGARRS
jgi:molybdenum cofactor cytidylyltransferase